MWRRPQSGNPEVDRPEVKVVFGFQPADHKLGERVDIVIMRAAGKHGELVQQILDPLALREQPAVWPRIGKPDVPRFPARLHRHRSCGLTALRFPGEDPGHLMAKGGDDGRPVRRVVDQDRSEERRVGKEGRL